MRKPDFFIVGAPKCGTTAMYRYLKQHPEIFMPDSKELHFFGKDLQSPYFLRDKERYLSLFSPARVEKRLGEASVWYLYSKSAAREIKYFSPSARIIIMLRNPADMLYSQHSQFLYNGNEDITDFTAALAAEEDRKKGRRIPKGVHFIQSLFYRETARYADQVTRYLDVFGPDKVHIIIYDDFRNDTAQAFRETLRFLGVRDDFHPDFIVHNPNKNIRSPLLRNIYSQQGNPVRRLGKLVVPPVFRERIIKRLKALNVTYAARKPLDAEFRKSLLIEFRPDIECLGRLIKRDLSPWLEDIGDSTS